MKFRALIRDQQSCREFHDIITTLSKVAHNKEAAIIIKTNQIQFVVSENAAHSIPSIWAEVDKDSFFPEYIMSGVDEEHNNQIVLTFNPMKMANALSLLKGVVKYCKIKLTNKDFPCLTVQLEIPSTTGRQITHDVPVTVIPTRDWAEFEIPQLPDFKSVISMPTLKSIRNLVEKIKNLAAHITFFCNNSGEIAMVVETDEVTVASNYKNLEVQLDDPDDKNLEVSCRVSAKELGTYFSCNQFQDLKMYCCATQDHVLKIVVEVRPFVSLNCILWAIAL